MWYQTPIKTVQNLKDKFPVVEVPDHSDEIRAMRDWCIQNDIVSTPTIYFDGYMLPKSMNLQDIHFFLKSKDRIPGLGADII